MEEEEEEERRRWWQAYPLALLMVCGAVLFVITETGETLRSSQLHSQMIRRKSQLQLSAIKTVQMRERAKAHFLSQRWAKNLLAKESFRSLITWALVVNTFSLLARGIRTPDPIGVLCSEAMGK